MDELMLKKHGLGPCRWWLVRRMRSTCYSTYILVSVILYAILLALYFFSHDIWFEERASEYLSNTEDADSMANMV